jgi:hypothetical protein
VEGYTDLTQVVLALRAARRLARPLNGRNQQRHQNADDGDDDEQFDQREPFVHKRLWASIHQNLY